MSDRFVREVWRITGDWTVDVQLVVDRERRRIEKAVRNLRRSDPALADRLTDEAAVAAAYERIDEAHGAQRRARARLLGGHQRGSGGHQTGSAATKGGQTPLYCNSSDLYYNRRV